MNLEDKVSQRENLEALAWLDMSLDLARDRGHHRAEDLLETVLAEVIFELDSLVDPPALT